MPATPAHASRITALLQKHGMLRASDLAKHGIPGVALTRLVASGQVQRLARGVYGLPEGLGDAHQTLAQVALCAPRGVICLLSALSFHEIGVQMPFEVWLLLPHGMAAPKMVYPALRIIRARNPQAMAFGVKTYQVGAVGKCRGVPVRMTSPARTVADCFKHHGQIGLEACLDALRDVLKSKKATPDELLACARFNRIEKRMRPYIEAML